MTASAHLRSAVTRHSWADARRNLQDLIFETVREAIDESGIAFADVDSVMLAAHDMVDGRSLSSMVSAPAAGAYLRDESRVGDDGAAAFALAVGRILAGQSRNCIVAAWGRASEGNVDQVSNALFDPFFAKPLALTETAVSALRASGALRRYPQYELCRADAASRRDAVRLRPAPARSPAPPVPLRGAEMPTWSDVVCAALVTGEPTDLRIAGVGLSSEVYWLGDRDLLRLTALEEASGRALEMAGCSVAELGTLELDGLTLFDEALAVEAVGAARPGEGMVVLATDARINRSGGYAAGYCAPAMGLARIVSAASQLRELARDERGTHVGLASGGSTVAAQTQTAIVLETC